MERPSESMKPFADRIARTAVREDATEIVRLLRLSGLMGETQNDFTPEGPGSYSISAYVCEPGVHPTESRHVGIWERRTENGNTTFVRLLEHLDTWHFWANLGRIEAKGAKRRVLLIGESVARGYLYDPDFTPAMALQTILEEQFGEGEIEVIDLARTNLGYEVRELALSALQLEPDIAIVFAGNNWGVSPPSFHDIAEIEKAMPEEGIFGVKRICDAYIAKTARFVANDIASTYKSRGVPLIWIIPEFNLADWRDPATSAPYFPGDLNREWLALLEQAQSAMTDGDYERAEKLAKRMLEIDQGLCVQDCYILAECRRAANDIEGERKYLKLANDAFSWDASLVYIPRPYTVTQETLRDELPKHGCEIIDVPVLFEQYLNGKIPGRRMFLDYCHLTTEGIQVVMGAAASSVLRSLKGVEVPWYTLVNDRITPSRETEAEAAFLAAIHDAHRYQPYDLVRYYCAQAVSQSPHIAELMRNYIDMQTRNSAPPRMSEAEEQIFRIGSPLIHRYIFRNNDKRLDRMLLKAIVEVLEATGIDAQEHLERVRREQHSVRTHDIDLLTYYYYSSAEQPQELEGLIKPTHRRGFDPHYYRAFWPHSKFVFVGEAGYPVNLQLTCRLPDPQGREEKVSIEFNGQPQVEFSIGAEWSTWDIAVPGQAVVEGINEVIVRWPMPEFPTERMLAKAVNYMCQRKFPDFFPIFGHIHSFIASNGAKVATDALVEQEVEAVAEFAK